MLVIKGIHRKIEGRQYIHFLISFDAGVDPEVALEICKNAVKYYQGKYQILAAVHLDTNNLHCHYVLNTVPIRGGRKFDQKRSDLYRFRRYIDKLLVERGLRPIEVMEEKKAEDVLDMKTFEKFSCDENELDDWHLLYTPINFHEDKKAEDKKEILSTPSRCLSESDTGNGNNIVVQSGIFQSEEKLFEPIRFLDGNMQFQPIRFFEKQPQFQPIIFHTNTEDGENNI